MLRCCALLYFGEQNEGVQNSINSYTNCASANDLILLLCCTELTYRVHPGMSQGVICNMIPHCMGPCHKQIFIETATYSYVCVPSHELTLCVEIKIVEYSHGNVWFQHQSSRSQNHLLACYHWMTNQIPPIREFLHEPKTCMKNKPCMMGPMAASKNT